MTRMHPVILLVVTLVVMIALTYFLVCRPDFELQASDPTGYAYLNAVRQKAGGVWSLSGRARCLVHIGVATALVMAAVIVAYGVKRVRRKFPGQVE
jgi:hypothetical protein